MRSKWEGQELRQDRTLGQKRLEWCRGEGDEKGTVATSASSPSEETLRRHSLGGGGRLFFTKYTKRHIPINKNVFKRMHFLPQI